MPSPPLEGSGSFHSGVIAPSSSSFLDNAGKGAVVLPLKLANPAPLRLTIVPPTSAPIAAITGTSSSGASTRGQPPQRPEVRNHEAHRAVDAATRLPNFAYNSRAPLLPGPGHAVAGAVRPVLSVGGDLASPGVGSVRPVVVRGWLEPHPRNLPPHVAARRGALQLPHAVLQRIFSFVDAAALDAIAVRVAKRWHHAVAATPELQRRRFQFIHEHDYDNNGIVFYLGSRMSAYSAPEPAAVAAMVGGQRKAVEGVERGSTSVVVWYPPCIGLGAPLRVSCAHVVRAGATHLPASGLAERRTALDTAAESRRRQRAALGSDSGRLPYLPNILSHGVTHFSTENLPFAWVGVDFGVLRVAVTHYTIGTSAMPHPPFPTAWELQGSHCGGGGGGGGVGVPLGGLAAQRQRRAGAAAVGVAARGGAAGSGAAAANAVAGVEERESDGSEEDEWGRHTWFVLDRREGGDTIFSSDRRSATFAVNSSVVEARGAVRKLRVVQIARNTHWGNELVISGLEFYGSLFRSAPGAE